MPLRLYRVCRAKYARLDGLGSRQAGGRWNSPGRSVVYMAESVALAVLENLVHMTMQDFPSGYVVVSAAVPDYIVVRSEADLRLLATTSLSGSQDVGDYWLEHRISVVLKVPSVVVPSEHIFLLNPAHPEFAAIEVEPPTAFYFDPRLFK